MTYKDKNLLPVTINDGWKLVKWNFTSILMTHAGFVYPGSHRSTIPPAWLPPAFLFTHMLVVHRSEGGGIYCLGSGEPWKLHYDIKGAAPAAGPAGTRLRYGTVFMKWQGTTR